MLKQSPQFFHKAARDGCLDVLRETTKKDCNKIDDDGLTPTLWAAFHGNLESLRLLIGRGGNPDKCDLFGSTALHLAATNGHLNCVTFLVSYGCNLWALDNNLHTPLEVAGLNNRAEVVQFLDFVSDKQSVLTKKLVKKWKEKAIVDVQKRMKRLNNIESKAQKRTERDLKLRKKKISPMSIRTVNSEPKPYSAHFTSQNKKNVFGGIRKKINQFSSNKIEMDGEFKIRGIESNGKKSIRSLCGLKRDSHIMYIRNTFSDTLSLEKSSSNSCDEFHGKLSDTISKAISEPEMFSNRKSFNEIRNFEDMIDRSGMFERPGFGNVSFINRKNLCGALMSFPSDAKHLSEFNPDTTQSKVLSDEPTRHSICNYDNSSIGTLGSLAGRMKTLPWGKDVVDEDYFSQNATLEFFLASNNISEYYSFFMNEDIDLQAMLLLTESDLKEIGLPMGPRRKLLEAKNQRQLRLAVPFNLVDSLL